MTGSGEDDEGHSLGACRWWVAHVCGATPCTPTILRNRPPPTSVSASHTCRHRAGGARTALHEVALCIEEYIVAPKTETRTCMFSAQRQVCMCPICKRLCTQKTITGEFHSSCERQVWHPFLVQCHAGRIVPSIPYAPVQCLHAAELTAPAEPTPQHTCGAKVGG